MNGANHHQHEILPHPTRRTQSNPGIPLVHHGTTEDRLEKGMGRPHTATYCV